jgi:hypothetical protein
MYKGNYGTSKVGTDYPVMWCHIPEERRLQENTVLVFFFTFTWPCIVTNFLIIKPTRCTNFSNLFWNEVLHVSDSSSVHHQDLFTVHSAICCTGLWTAFEQQDQGGMSWCCSKAVYRPVQHIPLPSVQWITPPDPAARKLSTNLYNILLSVQWINPDDGQRNCPKHVEFHSKINLRN